MVRVGKEERGGEERRVEKEEGMEERKRKGWRRERKYWHVEQLHCNGESFLHDC